MKGLKPELKQEIFKTIYFFSLFGSGIRKGDLRALLNITCSETECEKAVEELVREKKLEFHQPFFSLPGQGQKNVDAYVKSKPYIDKYWKKLRKNSFWWQFIPFVKAVFVGNSLAMGTANEFSDIDLVIITNKDRLFLARAILSVWIHLTGVRRHGDKTAGRFCLSFWLTEDSLSMKRIALDNDPYLYRWIATVKPVFGIESFENFKKVNKKYYEMFPNRPVDYRKQLLTDSTIAASWRKFWEKFLELLKIAFLLEKLCKKHQMKRAQEKYMKNGEHFGVIIQENILKFHEKDIRKEIAEKLLIDRF